MSTLHTPRQLLRAALTVAIAACLFWAGAAHATRMLYGASGSGNLIYSLPVSSDGSLSSVSQVSASDPQAVVVSGDGAHAYVAQGTAGSIAVFGVPSNGPLQYQSSASTGASPSAVALSPDGTLLFSADASGGVSVFTIASDGSLSSTPGSGLSLPTTSPDGIAVSPDGTHLFVAEGAANKLATFAIGVGGQLTTEDEATTGTGPRGIQVSPDGHYVYVANGGGSISAFSVSSTGDLTTVSGSPYTADGGARALALTPDGTHLVVAADSSGTVQSFTVSSNGVLNAVSGKPALTGAAAVAISPNGATVFVQGSAAIRTFGFTAMGGLIQRGADIATTGQPMALVVSPDLAPTAVIEVVTAYAGAATAFEGGHSTDPDGIPSSWVWNFGDGATTTGQHPEHVYANAGTYRVTLTVGDNEGCSVALRWASQMPSCAGGSSATSTQTITILDQPPPAQEVPPCIHDGNDGFCGTPDHKAPRATIGGVNDGSSIAEIDAPDEIGGFITPDPSGIKSVMLKLTKAAGFKTATKLVPVKRCRKVKGSKKKRCSYVKRCHKVKGKRKCTRVKKKKKVKTRIAVCDTIAPNKNYFIRKTCTDVAPISIGGDVTFRYSLPVALGLGTYTLEVVVTDNAGNTDVPEEGRNKLTFKIVNTPSNQGGGGGTITGPTTTTPSEPINDTGSPFG